MRYLIFLAASLISIPAFAICTGGNEHDVVECDGARISPKEAKALQESTQILKEMLKWNENARIAVTVSQSHYVEGTYGTLQLCSTRASGKCLPDKLSFAIERQPSFTKEFRLVNVKPKTLASIAELIRDDSTVVTVSIHKKTKWYETSDSVLAKAVTGVPALLHGSPLVATADNTKIQFTLQFIDSP